MSGVSAPSAIGRLRVVRPLGAGGFATVWLAHDPDLDAPVAVKILADNWATDADVRRRFTDEARLLRRVDSDHLVRVYDVGELPDGRPYFVMTYADQGSLAERLAGLPPPWAAPEVLRVVDAIAAGLAVLHEHGVVHRDLKPRNVLLRSTPDGPPRVLLGDLGIAKDLQWASGITMPAGSDGYMAPEQRGFSAEIGPATDVHALAMTAAQLLGLPGPPWPSTATGQVVARATTADPRARTSSATAFARDLWAALGATPAWSGGSTGAAPSAPSAGPAGEAGTVLFPREDVTRRGAPRRPWRTRGAAVAAVVLLGVLGVIGVLGRAYLTRNATLTSGDGRVRVSVPATLAAREDIAFPGGSDRTAGARASQGARAVSVAYADGAQPAAEVIARSAPAGCTPGQVSDARVGAWTGAAVQYVSCPDGVTVDEVVLSPTSGGAWTVWVEVRSVDGSPAVKDVLGDLQVSPR